MSPLRPLLLWASRNAFLRERIPRLGFARRAVRRFMPGEDLDAALAAAEELRARGISTVLTRLGENVSEAADADEVAAHYEKVIDRIAESGLDAEISIKPTQLGFDLDAEVARAHLVRIARRAERHGSFVWIDMESSEYVDATLDIYRCARDAHPNVGVCLQTYLYRTGRDVDDLLEGPAAIRLVKGAYAEPRDIAYPKKKDVDEAFFRLGERLMGELAGGGAVRLGLGTHDLELLRRLGEAVERRGLPRDAFEVQMLYGIRSAEQQRLADEGWKVRVLVSYGEAWYPWYLRRLAERPANMTFVLKSMVAR